MNSKLTRKRKIYRSPPEIIQLRNNKELLGTFRQLTESQEVSDCIAIAFDEFKKRHFTNNSIPHIHQHNQTSINAVRLFIEMFNDIGMSDPDSSLEDDEQKPDHA